MRRRLWAPLAAALLLGSALTATAQAPPATRVPRPPSLRGAAARPPSAPPVSYSTGTISWLAEDPQAPSAAPARPVLQPIQPVVLQRPMDNRPAPLGEETQDYHIRLTPPGSEQLFRRDSESQLLERMRQEALSQSRPERIEFPKEHEQLTRDPFTPRAFPPSHMTVEPNYTCYRRLNFEQLNAERAGWDLGFIAPFVSAAVFFKDVALLPYHMGTEPCRRYECNAGYCLPGTPVPLLLYPPELSLTGFLFEAGAITGIVLAFPGG